MRKILGGALLLSGMLASNAQAVILADLTGREVEVSVVTTGNGGQDFNAELFSASTATIGSGSEFTLRLTSGDFSGGANERFLELDFNGGGEVTAIPDQGFFFGAFYYNQSAAFDVTIGFTDSALSIVSATTSGDLAQGNASASGLDPVVWSFISEPNPPGGFAGIQIAFNQPSPGPVPRLDLTVDAAAVPAPATLSLMATGLAMLVGVRGLRGPRQARRDR